MKGPWDCKKAAKAKTLWFVCASLHEAETIETQLLRNDARVLCLSYQFKFFNIRYPYDYEKAVTFECPCSIAPSFDLPLLSKTSIIRGSRIEYARFFTVVSVGFKLPPREQRPLAGWKNLPFNSWQRFFELGRQLKQSVVRNVMIQSQGIRREFGFIWRFGLFVWPFPMPLSLRVTLSRGSDLLLCGRCFRAALALKPERGDPPILVIFL
jgi:hypothetical protein